MHYMHITIFQREQDIADLCVPMDIALVFFSKGTSNLVIGLFICLHMAALKRRRANRFIEKE